MKKRYKEKNVILHRGEFSAESLDKALRDLTDRGAAQSRPPDPCVPDPAPPDPCDKVSLWNLAPLSWPGARNSKMNDRDLEALMVEALRHSAKPAHLVLWMPAKELHRTLFDPLTMSGRWSPIGTILSGSDPLHVGYVYSNSRSWVDWATELILDGKGARGPNSTKTIKFMLDELGDHSGVIVDLFAHRSAVLPCWSRRLRHRYVGYTRSKKTFSSIVTALAQVELPGIQLSCLPS